MLVVVDGVEVFVEVAGEGVVELEEIDMNLVGVHPFPSVCLSV